MTSKQRLILDRRAAAVIGAAAKDEVRPVLNCVAIRDGWAVAVDGFKLAAVELPPAEPEGDDIPLPPLIPGGLVKDAMSQLGKQAVGVKAGITTHDNVALEVDRGNGRRAVLAEPAVDGTFPDVDHIWPKQAPLATAVLNVRRLRELMDIFEKASDEGAEMNRVAIRLYEGESAVEFRAVASDGRKTRALLMPMVAEWAPGTSSRYAWMVEEEETEETPLGSRGDGEARGENCDETDAA